MKTTLPTRHSSTRSEEGYILVSVMFMLAILIIAMAIAAPRIARSIQRDRELETMHRGKQYARAVKLYYKQFNAYPPTLDALVKTNEIRFLRKKYIDPTTGKDEWKPILFGQQKTQTMGFFGQPIAGSGVAGIGPGGGTGLNGNNGLNGASPVGGIGSSGSSFGSFTGGSASGSTGLGSGVITPGNPSDPAVNPAGAAGTGNGQTGDATSGGSGTGADTTGGSGAGGAGTGAAGTGSGSGSAFGTPSGQTFGGAGIIGFSPTSPKQSILVYKKKNHYNEWEFFYDPIAEQMRMQGGNTGTIGQPASGLNGSSPIGGTGIGGGAGIGGGSTIGQPGGTNPVAPPNVPTPPPQ